MCPAAALLIVVGMLGSAPSLAVVDGEGDRIRALFRVDLVGRSRTVFALPKGPRTVRSFRWISDPDAPTMPWRSARVRLVWEGDDEEKAGVDLPLGRFVAPEKGREDGSPPQLVNRRAMPYRRSARLVIDAEGEVRGSVEILADPSSAAERSRGYLRAVVDPERPEEIGENQGDGSAPDVRYWYDPRPGPPSIDEAGSDGPPLVRVVLP